MRNSPLPIFNRFFSISTLVIASATGFADARAATPTAKPALVKATSLKDVEVFSESGSISTYQWNLTDERLPLISLPDHIGEGLDLSLTYSMDQFQFPLFQSLYFNERVGKYILMVIPKQGRRAQFIDLDPVEGLGQFEARGESKLLLTDKGNLKLLSTSDGTVYTFAKFEDGELHCSQINDRGGLVINLRYTNNSSIDTISDASGRKVSFSYTNDYVSSVTQTWGADRGELTRTWAIALRDPTRATVNRVVGVPSGAAKHIPINDVKQRYTDDRAAP